MTEFGAPPPACPADLESEWLPFPSVVLTFVVVMTVCFVMALVCWFRYNSIQVYSKKIQSTQISNTGWVFYFLIISLSDLFVSIQYIVAPEVDSAWNKLFMGVSFALRGASTLFLTYSLHHQFKYRCGTEVEEVEIFTHIPTASNKSMSVTNSFRLVDRMREYKSRVDVFELFYALLTVCYWITVPLLFLLDYSTYSKVMFLSFYFVQQLPSVALIVLIVLWRYQGNESGPLL